MKIVTYNVNGLRPRISQFGSLRRFLDSLDADIICLQVSPSLFFLSVSAHTYMFVSIRMHKFGFVSLIFFIFFYQSHCSYPQETKLSRQEMRADLVQAEGYESFFACTRTSDKGRTGYSGRNYFIYLYFVCI